MMRKIAANYILLPGYPMVKNGYVLLEGQQVVDVVDTGGVLKEIQGLEFYGGMIVAGFLFQERFELEGRFLPLLESVYEERGCECGGLSIITGADLVHFACLTGTSLRRLV